MKLIVATVLALLVSATAFAQDFAFRACTSDKKIAVLAVNLNPESIAADTRIPGQIAKVFTDAATGLTAEQLVGREGAIAFFTGLSDEAKAAITEVYGAPKILDGACK